MPTVDNSGQGGNSGTSVSSFNITISVSTNADRALWLAVVVHSATITVSSAVLDPSGNNEALTEITNILSTNCRATWFELDDPTAGASQTLTVTISTATTNGIAGAVTQLSDAGTSRTIATNSGGGGGGTATITDSIVGDLCLDGFCGVFTGRAITADGGQSSIQEVESGAFDRAHLGMSSEAGTAANNVMGWTYAGGGQRAWAQGAIAWPAAPSAAASPGMYYRYYQSIVTGVI